MGRYAAKRSLQALLVILAVLVFTFVILRAIGDPARLLVSPEGSRENLEQIRRALGLDVPLHVQFIRFMGGIVRGDFGNSFTFGRPALGLVVERMPATLLLTFVALGAAVPVGMLLGMVSAVKRNTIYDNLATTVAVLGRAVPNFWLSIMLIVLFGATLKWLPPSGYGTAAHIVMPAFALGAGLAAMVARLTRSSLLEVMRHDYVRTARAKGLSERRVLFGHVLRNGLIPILTGVVVAIPSLFIGSLVLESFFGIPGLGSYTIDAINAQDFAVVRAMVYLGAVLYIVGLILTDVSYTLADPRIRLE